MSATISLNKPIKKVKPRRAASLKAKNEEQEIVLRLEELKVTLDSLHNMLNNITDPLLIDSCIYEMKAANIRYTYYLNQCKRKQVTAVSTLE